MLISTLPQVCPVSSSNTQNMLHSHRPCWCAYSDHLGETLCSWDPRRTNGWNVGKLGRNVPKNGTITVRVGPYGTIILEYFRDQELVWIWDDLGVCQAMLWPWAFCQFPKRQTNSPLDVSNVLWESLRCLDILDKHAGDVWYFNKRYIKDKTSAIFC